MTTILNQTIISNAIDDNKDNGKSDTKEVKLCIHICEKKKRRCKFNALKNCDYCAWHDIFNLKNENAEKRVPCPLDPKHSVYEKNLEKHLKKCNSKFKCLGEYDVKDINLIDVNVNELENGIMINDHLDLGSITTYKELNDEQMKEIIDFLISLDEKFNLYNLEFKKLQSDFFDEVCSKKNETLNKHLKQISQIVGQVDSLIKPDEDENKSICLVELGAGRGKLSYWFEQSRINSASNNKKNKKFNILLIERGSQRYKFDYLLKKEIDETNAEFDRIRIDLKDLFLNQVPIIKNSDNYILYGKHLCGVATDFSIRCLKHSLEDATKNSKNIKFGGLVLAVCCHHKCEWESFCGQDFLKSLNINSKLFYIIRSISSWSTSGEKNSTPPPEFVFGHNRQKLGKICKNLFDFARMEYIKNNINVPSNVFLKTKLFNYIESAVTLENTMIYVSLENKI